MSVSSAVAAALKAVYSQPGTRVVEGSLDDRCLSALAKLPESEALRCVKELTTTDLNSVRNIAAYFTTICRRASENAQGGAPAPPPTYEFSRPPEIPRVEYYPHHPAHFPPPGVHHPPPIGIGGPHPPSLALNGPGPWLLSATDLNTICHLAGGSYAQLHAALSAGGAHPPMHAPPPHDYAHHIDYAHHPHPPAHMGPPANYSAPPHTRIGVPDGIEARIVSKRIHELLSQGVIDSSTLDQKAVDVLNTLRPDDALSALDELETVMKNKTVRNPSAFFMGICKSRVQKQREEGAEDNKRRKYDDGSSRTTFQSLPAAVLEKIASYSAAGVFPGKYGLEGELDSKAVDRLLTLSEEEQLSLIDEVANSDLRNVRNLCAFMLSKIGKK